ncbi:MAG: OpgC domain-containing protein [Hyphomicrobiaceae bacterium]|nr:OpgC domain-containing protein [Hyphomicrobiaceae bacterium]
MSPPTTPSHRDYRIDWLRGLALATIFINHMPGNRFEFWTPRNFGFSDSAEIFVLLAGVAAGLAFFKKFERGDAFGASRKAVRRAGVLYGAHLLSTVMVIAMFSVVAFALGNSDVYDLIDIRPLIEQPLPGIIGVMSGGLQLGYFNILPMYVVLLLLLPAFLWLARIDVKLMLGASMALYLVANVGKVNMPGFPDASGWYFNPLAWQLIFAVGVALGIMRQRGHYVSWHPLAGTVAALYVVYAFVWVVWSFDGGVSVGLLPEWVDTLAKSNLPLARVAHVLAMAYLLVHSPIWPALQRLGREHWLIKPWRLMGQYSLPVFVFGSLLSMAGYLTLVHTGHNLPLEIALTVGGLAAMVGLASAKDTGIFSAIRLPVRRGAHSNVVAHELIDQPDETTVPLR